MMKRPYDWMMRMAGHDKAPQALFWVAFIESSVFPIPPDVMLIPMILARRAKAWIYATICTVGSVIGGIGRLRHRLLSATRCRPPDHRLLRPGAEVPGVRRSCSTSGGCGFSIAKGWTPFPYKVLTIAAGAFKMSVGPFILASIVARAMRFYLVAALLYWFGEPIRDFIEKRLSWSRRPSSSCWWAASSPSSTCSNQPGYAAMLLIANNPERTSAYRAGALVLFAAAVVIADGAGLRACRRLCALPPVPAAALRLLRGYSGPLPGAGAGLGGLRTVAGALFLLVAAAFLANAGLGIYHAGRRVGIVAGPRHLRGCSAAPQQRRRPAQRPRIDARGPLR